MIVANLGCGESKSLENLKVDKVIIKKVVHFDIRPEVKPDIVCDLRSIPEPDNKYDIVYANHILEHFYKEETLSVLKEWLRILKPQGRLIIIVPDTEWALKSLSGPNDSIAKDVLYGGRHNPYDYHQSQLTTDKIKKILKKIKGISTDKVVSELEQGIDSGNIFVEITKL